MGRPETVISEKPQRVGDSNGSRRKKLLLKDKWVSNWYVTVLLITLGAVTVKNRVGRKADSTIFTRHRRFLEPAKIKRVR